MKSAKFALAAGLILTAAATAMPGKAEARPLGYFSLSLPGFHLDLGRHDYGRHYRRGYYRPYTYYSPRRPSRCGTWSRRCARNWGYGNKNWRGCMRHYGCR